MVHTGTGRMSRGGGGGAKYFLTGPKCPASFRQRQGKPQKKKVLPSKLLKFLEKLSSQKARRNKCLAKEKSEEMKIRKILGLRGTNRPFSV